MEYQRALSSSISRKSLDISGIYPPICTPYNHDESITFDKLEYNMKKWNQIPFKGYVVQGSNAEWCFQSWDERVQVVRETARLAAPGRVIMAGSGCESTRDTIRMCKDMSEAGAHALLVVNPFYFKDNMTSDALVAHFTAVADHSPLPIVMYNVPRNTGVDIPVDAVVKLAQHHNIIGIKDSGGDITRIASIVFATASSDFQVLAGSAGFLLAAYNVGCVGGICALANVLGEETCRLADLAQSNDLKAAMDLQLRLVGPNSCVTKRFGVPGLKTSMEWFGYYGGPPRSPLQSLSDNQVQAIKSEFQKSFFL
ncbi:4-hydroxy-tetrahydrodipicolinate synthase [Plakobranchus ocellatus]|uniref:4-hydroxy-2-oxoglutarate aldolase, mitochondrial n=1 Tax=Plakobranchus ocellatus TaxID=259542 RepID=A0AAV4D1L8_9GAST|nr:4-hydroxy-tetrahydrodipicolinate synthase [Plakobranchus ocellatus]